MIDADELRRELPGEHTDEDLKKMIAEADTNGDGKIDFKEFISYVVSKHTHTHFPTHFPTHSSLRTFPGIPFGPSFIPTGDLRLYVLPTF